MPELKTPDGAPVDLDAVKADANATFSRAMAAGEPEPAAPPKVTRAEKADETPRRRARPPKDDKPRTAPKASALSAEARAAGVKGLVQVGAGLCLIADRASKGDAFKADAVTLVSAADQIADACVQTAAGDARFAAALDKVCSAGPYAALVSVMVGVGTQIARNHKPALSLPGTVHPDELLRARSDQMEEAHA